MATTYFDRATKAGDQVLSAVGGAQETVVTTVATVSEAVGSFIPELPALPLVDQLPTAKEIVTRSFAFAGKVLDSQKTYALNLVEALEPLSSKVMPAPKKARKATAKTETA